MFIRDDVEGMRERLAAKGALMGPLENYPPLTYCDGKDPEGNIFQITNNRTSERVN
jgi:hypothetical protein